MRAAGSVAAIAIGGILLFAISQGYTKNFQAGWNALVGGGAMNPNAGTGGTFKGAGASGSWAAYFSPQTSFEFANVTPPPTWSGALTG